MKKAILGKKIGMTQMFRADGTMIPVTVIEAGPCPVIQKKTVGTDGYEAVQVGFSELRAKLSNKPRTGHFAKAGVKPLRYMREFKLDDAASYQVGQVIKADTFVEGDKIDVRGVSKGKGFQGVIKRHGYKGGPGGHGSMFHRAPGSIGQCADPAETYKGKGMPGHMGCVRRTSSFIEIVRIDTEKNLVLLRGAVPGPTEALIMIKKSVKGGK